MTQFLPATKPFRLHVPAPLDRRRMALLQISPNRACNIRCNHCFIPDLHKGVNAMMDEPLMDITLERLGAFVRQLPAQIIEIELIGGEIHLLPADLLRSFGVRMVDWAIEHLQWRNRTGYMADRPAVINVNLITNLINIEPSKLDAFVAIQRHFDRRMAELEEQLRPHMLEFCIPTSFEPDTNRFYRPRVLEKWKDAVRYLRQHNARVGVILTATKGLVAMPVDDVLDMMVNELEMQDVSLDYMAPFGESKRNPHVIESDYQKMVDYVGAFIVSAQRRNLELGRDGAVDPIPHHGGTIEYINCRCLAEVSIDCDGTVAQEEMASSELQHQRDARTFNIQDGTTEEVVDRMLRTTQKRLNADLMQMVRKNCIPCEHVEVCQGGHRYWVDFFETPGACAGLKPMLDRFLAVS